MSCGMRSGTTSSRPPSSARASAIGASSDSMTEQAHSVSLDRAYRYTRSLPRSMTESAVGTASVRSSAIGSVTRNSSVCSPFACVQFTPVTRPVVCCRYRRYGQLSSPWIAIPVRTPFGVFASALPVDRGGSSTDRLGFDPWSDPITYQFGRRGKSPVPKPRGCHGDTRLESHSDTRIATRRVPLRENTHDIGDRSLLSFRLHDSSCDE